jgi:hypothetical protein
MRVPRLQKYESSTMLAAADELERLEKAHVADAAMVVEWAMTPNRKPAQLAFTAGPERQAAYWIEWVEARLGKSLSSNKELRRLAEGQSGD